MSEQPPEIRVEIVNLGLPELSDREELMHKIDSLVQDGHYAAAQTLVEETGIPYSEAHRHVHPEEN
jgi:hypothetical protein